MSGARIVLGLGRREWLLMAGAGLSAGFLRGSGAEFWDTVPPGQWTPEQIAKLVTDSPWAKAANIEFVGEPDSGSEAPPPSGLGGPSQTAPGARQRPTPGGGSPIGVPRGGARPGPSNPMLRTNPSGYRATLVWESARPVRDAAKTTLPGGLADQYVISVSGNFLPRDRAIRDEMKNFALLRLKDKDPVKAGTVTVAGSPSPAVLFGFLKDRLAIGAGDTEVVFQLQVGGLRAQALFNPSTMLYRGDLAL